MVGAARAEQLTPHRRPATSRRSTPSAIPNARSADCSAPPARGWSAPIPAGAARCSCGWSAPRSPPAGATRTPSAGGSRRRRRRRPRTRLPASDVRAACARAEILLARGAARAAAAVAERAAAAAADRIPAPMDAADARLLAGRALAAAGETERAEGRAAAGGGRRGARRARCGCATPPSASCGGLGTRASLAERPAPRSAPARPHRRASSGIAELVAHGHSNKQVGAAALPQREDGRRTRSRASTPSSACARAANSRRTQIGTPTPTVEDQDLG